MRLAREKSPPRWASKRRILFAGIVDIWGSVPVPLLRRLGLQQSLYGYVGMQDKSMAPLLPPGSFVQIDTKQNRIRKGPFKKSSSESHFARPIYFLDTRKGYKCGWCELKDGVLTPFSIRTPARRLNPSVSRTKFRSWGA